MSKNTAGGSKKYEIELMCMKIRNDVLDMRPMYVVPLQSYSGQLKHVCYSTKIAKHADTNVKIEGKQEVIAPHRGGYRGRAKGALAPPSAPNIGLFLIYN